jgi:hypothetical protein
MKRPLLLLAIAFLLGGSLARVVYAQKPAEAKAEPKAATPPADYELTESQRWRMTAAQQEFFRWQDKVNEAAEKFGQACHAAQLENHWPDIVCHIDTLAVTPKSPQPANPGQAAPALSPGTPTSTPPPAPPPAAKEKSPPGK